MDIGAIFFILALLTLVGLYVGQPFTQRRTRRAAQDHDYSTLMAEYERVVNALKELEFDNLLAKIPAGDYPDQRASLLVKGADLLRQLDVYSSNPGGNANGQDRNAQERIEAAVAARRADSTTARKPGPGVSDDELESLIVNRRKARKEKSAGFCPKCGKPIQVSDRFCPICGKAVN